ncbi:MAG: glutamate racemase [Thermodesulfobacteriota bacterium]
MAKEGRIGVFDSGIGGLTVLREVRTLLPGEETIYLGDTARVPYGTKSGEAVIRYSLEVAGFMKGKGIKMLVVACNTASAYALPALKEALDVPVVGVIEPGAATAAEATMAKRIGVIGTEATIKSGAYFDAIKAIDSKTAVYMKACPLFVPLAEEGWLDNDVTRLTAESYLANFKKEEIDILVLGCTHYPLLKPLIAGVMGKGVTLIDSARATAAEVKRILQEKGLVRDADPAFPAAPPEFFVTDSPERFATVGKRFFGDGLVSAELVRLGDS